MKRKIIAAAAMGLAVAGAPLVGATPLPQTTAGEQCMQHLATTTDPNGNALVCVHGPDTGHIMYWYRGSAADYPGL